MVAPEPEVACREAIACWSSIQELVEFAERRHGYSNSNCGSGVTYPEDLDEYEITLGEISLARGQLKIYRYRIAIPPGWEILVAEQLYLQILSTVLRENGFFDEAEKVGLIAKRFVER
ncbi:hypothetical protein FEM03_18130 [Phragmitibacter flavus]|uniref:Uncharacterized protein n=1 Tax=Phragmitibacter flavus TaxID=2576071 RepID=A0A5R8KAG8_9BACT|nr:hypothetical protein [Phragmitibacter flavus]TLD69291.1 hypothetical protein FEM03_18130 [Phragmitibacter flavus]